jgi:hypothetical protein
MEVSTFEVRIGINPHQPAIGIWFVSNFFVKFEEIFEEEENAAPTVVVVEPAPRIATP